jgi:hypothetical protein
MTADFGTKSLQGSLFKKFRDRIMGVVVAQDPGSGKTETATKPAKKSAKTLLQSKVERSKPKEGKKKSLVQSRTTPQECVGARRKGRKSVKAEGSLRRRIRRMMPRPVTDRPNAHGRSPGIFCIGMCQCVPI